MGLNENYTAVRGNILMMNPFPSLSQIYSLFAARVGLHNAPRNPFTKRPEGRRASLFYSHCKRTGHIMDKCYKLHGYPNNNRQGGRGRTLRGANCTYGDQDTQTSADSIQLRQHHLPILLYFQGSTRTSPSSYCSFSPI